MSESYYQHYNEKSYLSCDQWVLTVHTQQLVPSIPPKQITMHSEIEIAASYNSMESWNQRFWSLFLKGEEALLDNVEKDAIIISTDFSFHPTATLKQTYGKYSMAKIRRVADHWRHSKTEAPVELGNVIADYERDQSAYSKQYNLAWQELVQRRLPIPPFSFYWYNYSGGLLMCHDVGGISLPMVVWFRLWHKSLGFEPRQE